MLDFEVGTELLELLIVEQSTIISDQGIRYYEPINDIPRNEVRNFCFSNCGQGFRLTHLVK